MTREEYNSLYEKYLSGRCTPAEKDELENYQDNFNLDEGEWDQKVLGTRWDIKQSIQEQLIQSLDKHSQKRRSVTTIWYSAAAIIMFALASGIYFNRLPEEPVIAKTNIPVLNNDVLPGDNRAVLTLDDGSQINLDDAKNGILANENNTDIKKTGAGQLEYSNSDKLSSAVKYNTLKTPMGGQYQLVLPDGSKVWLNSASSLRFPTSFTGSERIVELTGEAYFEIAENKKVPFLVRSGNDMEVKVLGTHFNVMAYEDEKSINTTLLEGSVQILKGGEKTMLKPGQAAALNRGTGNIRVAEADLEQAVAWKNGYFIFDNENIESIMRKVSRWYNVEVKYEGNLSNKDFVGTISRHKNVSELLKMLELTGAIHFKINERRIIVMP